LDPFVFPLPPPPAAVPAAELIALLPSLPLSDPDLDKSYDPQTHTREGKRKQKSLAKQIANNTERERERARKPKQRTLHGQDRNTTTQDTKLKKIQSYTRGEAERENSNTARELACTMIYIIQNSCGLCKRGPHETLNTLLRLVSGSVSPMEGNRRGKQKRSSNPRRESCLFRAQNRR
jgi:hypothetical protein